MAWFASWLWEGVVIVLLVSAMLRGLRRVDAATRYAIWWGTLLAIICWPAVSFARVLAYALFSVPVPAVSPVAASAARGHLVEFIVPSAPVWALRAAVGLWFATVSWKLSRLGIACWQLRRVKRSCAPLTDVDLARLPLWNQVSQRGRGAQVCVSDRVGVACALGFRRPMIALPRQFVDQLASRDLDQVTLHEYAHLQRRDDWARLVQLGVDAVCGWHPAIRWISRQLTFEREVACDDWVVQRTHDPLGYARCLTTLAERTVAGQATTLSPAAWSTEAVVVRRVQRVLDARRNTARSASRWRLAVAVAVVALCAGEAGRVLALQDATDRIVASTPIAGTLSEAVTAEAFGGIAAAGIVDADAPLASRTRTAEVAALEPAIASSTTLPRYSGTGGEDRSATAAGQANADLVPSIGSIPGSAADAVDRAHAAADASGAPVVPPSVQRAFALHGEEANPLGPATPQTGFAALDLTASLDDLVLDDDVDHDHQVAPSTLDQPAHNGSAMNVRAVRPRTRGTGFFARVGRSIVHILGTHTRSPATVPDSRRRRA